MSHTNACILDAHGKKVMQLTVRGPWTRVIEEPAELKANLSVCYEASRGYGCLYDQLGSVARRVVVAHPGQLRLIFRSKRKNDRVDARKPAKLLFLDEAPTVFVPSQNVRAWRQLIGYRVRLLNKRTRAKNSRPKRFRRTKSIGVYLVLIPCQNESGTASYFERIERGKQDRGKIAIVATAHYLASK